MAESDTWQLKMLPETSWDLATAVCLARELQPVAHAAGYNLLLGGGVLNTGRSDKDLDLVILPRGQTNLAVLLDHLSATWRRASRLVVDVRPGRVVHKLEDQRGRRLDLIVVLDSPRTLAEVVAEAEKHYEDNPRHGVGCACMDTLVREIRDQLRTSGGVGRQWVHSALQQALRGL